MGSVQEKPQKGRPHTATSVERVEEVHELVGQNPHISTRRLAARVKTSFYTVLQVSLARLMPHPALFMLRSSFVISSLFANSRLCCCNSNKIRYWAET